jgi:hypothetical protein
VTFGLFEGVMFRLVVATYLMLVTAVGPMACCCTLTRLTQRLAPAESAAPEAPAGCCHHAPPSTAPAEKGDRPSPADAPGCPCKQGVACDVVALPAVPDEAVEGPSRAAPAGDGLPLVILPFQAPSAGGSFVSHATPGLGASVSTDDLLYAFHILRC